ncbi:MAG: ChaN family lipoprotein, partial [Nitrospiraceae bacterium]
MPHSFLLRLIMSAMLLVLHAPAAQSADMLPANGFREWQIIDVKAARPISFEEWGDLLNDQDVIYLGEEHRNKWHIEAALRILRVLIERHRNPVLAVEMFGWDGQAGLNRYLSEEQTSRDQFLEASRWDQNWGGSFDDYAPLITFARDQRVPVLALNPPRPLVRRVASHGLARALADVEMSRWGMQGETFVDNPAYRDVIVRQLRLCHGGMSEEGYQRMYEASLFRDESMAKTITDHLARMKNGEEGAGPMISYTGGG